MEENKKLKQLSPTNLKHGVKLRILGMLDTAPCSREKLSAYLRLETGLSSKVLDQIIDDMILIELIGVSDGVLSKK